MTGGVARLLRWTDPAPLDPACKLARALAMERIHSALGRLGLTFGGCHGIVDYDPQVATACWQFDPKTGDERILLGPKICGLPVESVEMVLRHELLHRSVYHLFAEHYPHPQLANIALDICINRLLHETWPREMEKLSEEIYPAESNATPICLCNCAARWKAGHRWQELWAEIWGPPEAAEQPHARDPLNPASLYFRLRNHLPEIEACWRLNPHPLHDLAASPATRRLPKRIRRALRKALEGMARARPRGSGTGHALAEYAVEPANLGTSELEAFLLRLPVRRQLTELAAKITEPATPRLRTLPYPVRLSRKGLVFAAVGISDLLHLYHNLEPARAPARLIISLYMDVSGSMTRKFPVVASCIETLKEYPLKVFTFDTKVREQAVEDLMRGHIRGGGGTDFDAVASHILANPVIRTAVIFTDGYGNLAADNLRRLTRGGYRLFVVYLLEPRERVPAGNLDRVACDTIRLPCR